MQTLSPAFLREAGRAANFPFSLMTIESRGQSAEITSEADWGTATAETNMDYTSTPPDAGDVQFATDSATLTYGSKVAANADLQNEMDTGTYADVDEDPYSDADYISHSNTTPATPQWVGDVGGRVLASIPSGSIPTQVRITLRVKDPNANGTAKAVLRYNGTDYYSAGYAMTNAFSTQTFAWATIPGGGAWTRETIDLITGFGYEISSGFATKEGDCSQAYIEVEHQGFQSTGSITLPFDLGASAVTANKAIISIVDYIPTGAGITYTIEGSTTGAWGGEEVALGAVEDGSTVAGYRYYRITATFTGDGTVTGVIKSIKIEIPDRIYKFSTLSGDTFSALPLIVSMPGRSIELDLTDFVSKASSMSVTISSNETTQQMLRENYFRGLRVKVDYGLYYTGIVEGDLAPYYKGKVVDYSVTDSEITIHIKDASKDLSRKLPEDNTTGAKTPSTDLALTYDKTHMVDVIADLADRAGLATRELDLGSFSTVKASVGDLTPGAAGFVAYRGASPPIATGDTTITEPKPAREYITELLLLLGCYLPIQENGKLTMVEYDSTATAAHTWTDDDWSNPSYEAGLEALKNLCTMYYDATGTSDNAKDFDSGYVTVDGTSVTNWGITANKIIKSLWVAGSSSDGYFGDELSAHITDREVTRLLNGLGILSLSTSMQKAEFQVGDMVNISGMSHIIIKPDIGLGDTVKFMLIKKQWGLERGGAINWLMMEAR